MNNNLNYLFLTLLIVNTAYLKFLICSKVYYLIKYTKAQNIPNRYNRFLYLLINSLFILLISFLVFKNDLIIINIDSYLAWSDSTSVLLDLFIVIYSYLFSLSCAIILISNNYLKYDSNNLSVFAVRKKYQIFK